MRKWRLREGLAQGHPAGVWPKMTLTLAPTLVCVVTTELCCLGSRPGFDTGLWKSCFSFLIYKMGEGMITSRPMHVKKLHKLWKCSWVECHCLHDRHPLPGPSLKWPHVFLGDRSEAGHVLCSAQHNPLALSFLDCSAAWAPGPASYCPRHFLESHCADNCLSLFLRSSPRPSSLGGQVCILVIGVPRMVFLQQVLGICGGTWMCSERAQCMAKDEFKSHPWCFVSVFINSFNTCELSVYH